mmetsp:Transcript_26980/g.56673  ORF Transcript_26980/g.56673 Transcript_26980/m.56673 type:complete len:291 (-) Transcript_26980:5118-5990(-)
MPMTTTKAMISIQIPNRKTMPWLPMNPNRKKIFLHPPQRAERKAVPPLRNRQRQQNPKRRRERKCTNHSNPCPIPFTWICLWMKFKRRNPSSIHAEWKPRMISSTVWWDSNWKKSVISSIGHSDRPKAVEARELPSEDPSEVKPIPSSSEPPARERTHRRWHSPSSKNNSSVGEWVISSNTITSSLAKSSRISKPTLPGTLIRSCTQIFPNCATIHRGMCMGRNNHCRSLIYLWRELRVRIFPCSCRIRGLILRIRGVQERHFWRLVSCCLRRSRSMLYLRMLLVPLGKR